MQNSNKPKADQARLHSLEHREIKCIWNSLEEERIKKLRADPNGEKTLGLHYNQHGKLCPGDYVGLVWLDEPSGVSLQVGPKFFDERKQMDYLCMYLRCAEDPIVSAHLENCFYIWPEEPLIKISDQRDDLSLLIVAVYLATLYNLCIRHLRRNFIRIDKNFTGKAKGKIVPSAHIRKNIVKARTDRLYCQYQIISDDCRENQILKSALRQCVRYLKRVPQQNNFDILWQWIRFCETSLSEVSLRRIPPLYFHGLRYSGCFIHYRNPHRLAKMVLKMLGPDPTSKEEQDPRREVPPFALCTFELFERFAETQLRKSNHEIWVGDSNLKPQNGEIKVRPDFLIKDKDEESIVDCKYKKMLSLEAIGKKDVDEIRTGRDDVYQVIAYSAHQKVLSKLNLIENSEKPKKIILLYPKIVPAWNKWTLKKSLNDARRDDSFNVPLYLCTLDVPGKLKK